MKEKIDKEKIKKIIFEQIIKASIENIKDNKVSDKDRAIDIILEGRTSGGTLWSEVPESKGRVTTSLKWITYNTVRWYSYYSGVWYAQIDDISEEYSVKVRHSGFVDAINSVVFHADSTPISRAEIDWGNSSLILKKGLDGKDQQFKGIVLKNKESGGCCEIEMIKGDTLHHDILTVSRHVFLNGYRIPTISELDNAFWAWNKKFGSRAGESGADIDTKVEIYNREWKKTDPDQIGESIVWTTEAMRDWTGPNSVIDDEDVEYSGGADGRWTRDGIELTTELEPIGGLEISIWGQKHWVDKVSVNTDNKVEFITGVTFYSNGEKVALDWSSVGTISNMDGGGVLIGKGPIPKFNELEVLASNEDYTYPDEENRGRDPFAQPTGGWLKEALLREDTPAASVPEGLAWISGSGYKFPDGVTTNDLKRRFCSGLGGLLSGKLDGEAKVWPNPGSYEDLYNGFSCSTYIQSGGVDQTWEMLQSQQRIARPGSAVKEKPNGGGSSSTAQRSSGGRRRGTSNPRIVELQSLLGINPTGRWSEEIDKKWKNEISSNLHDLFISPTLLNPILEDWNGVGKSVAGDLFQGGANFEGSAKGMIQFITLTRDTARTKELYYARPPDIGIASAGTESVGSASGSVIKDSLIVIDPFVMTVTEISKVDSKIARKISSLVAGHIDGESEDSLTIERKNLNRLSVTVPSGVDIKNMSTFKSSVKSITEPGMKISFRIRKIHE